MLVAVSPVFFSLLWLIGSIACTLAEKVDLLIKNCTSVADDKLYNYVYNVDYCTSIHAIFSCASRCVIKGRKPSEKISSCY